MSVDLQLVKIAVLALLGSCHAEESTRDDADHDGESTNVDARIRHGEPSSLKRCWCWPDGASCVFPSGKSVGPDEAYRCIDGEFCNLSGQAAQNAEMGPRGKCAKPCFHTEADIQSEYECAIGDRCIALNVEITWEGEVTLVAGLCVRDVNYLPE